LNILVLGHEQSVQSLIWAMQKEDIKIVCNPDLSSIPSMIFNNEIDMVVVDSTMPGADSICRRISNFDIVPVVLIMNQIESSWENIQSCNADAFISEGASNNEILARIKAVYRRSKLVQGVTV
jgi:DNA-binding response OmpR family regulator